MRRTPGVEGVGVVDLLFFGPAGPALQHLLIAAPVDRALGTEVDRPRLVAGRLANPNALDEINIGEGLAALTHLGVGDTIDAMLDVAADVRRPQPRRALPARRARSSICASWVSSGARSTSRRSAARVACVLLTPAFDRAYRGRIANPAGYTIRVRASDVPRVTAAVNQIFGKDPNFQPQGLEIESAGARDAINVLTDVLLIFAAVAGLAGVVAIAIVLNRELASSQLDQPALLALGTTRLQRTGNERCASVRDRDRRRVARGRRRDRRVAAPAVRCRAPRRSRSRACTPTGECSSLGALAVVAVVLAIAVVAALRSTRIAARRPRTRRARVRDARRRRAHGHRTLAGRDHGAAHGDRARERQLTRCRFGRPHSAPRSASSA